MPTQRNNGFTNSGRMNIPDPTKPAKARKASNKQPTRGFGAQSGGMTGTKPTKRQGVTKRTAPKKTGDSSVFRSQTFRQTSQSGVLRDQMQRFDAREQTGAERRQAVTGRTGSVPAREDRATGRSPQVRGDNWIPEVGTGSARGFSYTDEPMDTGRGRHSATGRADSGSRLQSSQIPRVAQTGSMGQRRQPVSSADATASGKRAGATGRSVTARSQKFSATGATGTGASQTGKVAPDASMSKTGRRVGPLAAAAQEAESLAIERVPEAPLAEIPKDNSLQQQPRRDRSTYQSNTRRSVKGKQGKMPTANEIKKRIMYPLVALVALFLVLGVGDLVFSMGKIHSGVTVQGVDVGGLTESEASEKIVKELTPVLDKAKVTVYEDEDIAALDGVDLSGGSGVEKALAASKKSGTDIDGDGSVDKWKVTSDTVGMYIDGDALAKKAFSVGRSIDFFRERVGSLLFGTKIDANVSISEERFGDLASEINKVIGKETVDSKAVVTNGKAELKKGHDGKSINQERFAAALSDAVFGSVPALAAPMDTQERHIKPETAKRVVKQINDAIAAEVTVVYKDDKWTLGAEELGDLISQKVLEPGEKLVIGNGTQKVLTAEEVKAQAEKDKGSDDQQDGTAEDEYDLSAGTDADSGWILQAYVNQKKADNYLVSILGDKAVGGAKDATFYIKNDKVKIKPSKEGKGPDRKPAELQLQRTLFGNQSSVRTIEIADTIIQPNLTTEQAEAMGIKDKLASWSISSPGSEARQHNLMQMCKYINKSLVAPGQVWSFIETVGEMTEERGFKKAPVIVNGRHEDGIGGGACQVASCVFNCACFSGLGIESRTNHDFYISQYDDRGFADATVSWDALDFKWLNDMENYILVTAKGDGDEVSVQFWGTDEGRKVTCDRGKWKKGESYKSIRENNDELPAGTTRVEQSGVNGRSIIIHYIAEDKNGKVLHDIKFNSVYVAQNEIISVGTKTS